MYTLKLKNTHTGEVIDVTKSIFRIGRHAEADISTKSNVVSKNHATISMLVDGVYVQDQKSLNGTFINNKKIVEMTMNKIKHGDVVGFGCNSLLIAHNSLHSPLIYEVILEYPVTQQSLNEFKEPSTSCVKKEQSFSDINHDSCIVISDDEDDLIANSQIFHITEKIKKEQSFNAEFDPFQDIKEELRDLDQCAKEIEVDLTEEACHNTMELLDILQSDDENNSEKKEEKDSEQQKNNKEIIIPLQRQSITSTKNHSVIDVSDNEIEISTMTPKPPPRRISRVGKNKGPPIIEPHVMQNKTKEKKEPVGGKRKNAKDATSSKKLRTTKTPPPAAKIDTKARTEEIKRNLKELTNKSRNEETVNSKVTKAVKVANVPKVKVSDSRGGFLLESVNLPSTSKTRSSVSAKTLKVHDSSLNEIKSVKIQDSTVNSTIQIETIKRKEISTSVNQPEFSTTIVDRSESIQKSDFLQFLTTQTPSYNRNWTDWENVDNEVNEIVQWSINWLMEQNNTDISPFVAGTKELSQIPNIFKSHQQYVDVMKPLVYLELWQFIYQSMSNKEGLGEPMIVNIVHKRKYGQIIQLDCECVLYENGSTTIRPEDITIIEMKVTDNKHCYKYVAFGYIKSANRLNRNERFRAECNFGFTIVTKHLQGKEIFDNNLLIIVITNIGGSLRLLKTLKCLKKTWLGSRILDPEVNILNLSSTDTLLNGMKLNKEQALITTEAANFCLEKCPGIYLMKGPPGTGKTTVIVSIIFQMLFKSLTNGQNPLILLTSPSNAAIDGLILKIAEYREKLGPQRRLLRLIRMGPEASISKKVDKFKLSYFAQKDVLAQSRLQYTEEFKNYTENGGDLNGFLKNSLKNQYYQLMKAAEEKILLGSNVICTTLKSCVGYRLLHPTRKGQLRFTCCIIDEATQCTELESLLPTQLGIETFVLVGDPQQLPAVVCNKDAQKLGYGNSLFSRMYTCLRNKKNSPIRMLYNQYRMHPEICAYPNKRFYEGKLRSYPVCNNVIIPHIKPYILFNLKSENDNVAEYVDNDEANVEYMNNDEAKFIYMMLMDLKNTVKTNSFSVGIIAPYKAQKELLQKMLSTIKFGAKVILTVNTVDSFQGSENDIIIISCVRNNPNNFVQNEQRLNVALTRAKQALYIIGNYTLFKQCRPLYDLREDAKKRNLCFDVNLDTVKSLKKFIFV